MNLNRRDFIKTGSMVMLGTMASVKVICVKYCLPHSKRVAIMQTFSLNIRTETISDCKTERSIVPLRT